MPAGSNAPVAVHAGHLLARLLAHDVAEDIQHGHLGLLPRLVLHVTSNTSALVVHSTAYMLPLTLDEDGQSGSAFLGSQHPAPCTVRGSMI